MKVLLVGQLPKEIGGNYTTGVANVVYELGCHTCNGLTFFTYGTNISHKAAKHSSTYSNQYLGYKFRPLHIALKILLHPFQTIKEWKHYRSVYNVNPIRYEVYRDNFERVIKLVRPDLLNVHGQGIAPLYYANQKYKLPLIQTFHGVSNADDPEAVANRPKNIDEAKHADYVTCLTDEIKHFCIETLNVNRANIEVIPNGCDTSKFFYSTTLRNTMRKEYGITSDQIVFITASTVHRRKGQLAFCKLLEKLDLNCQYWIIGKGPDWQNVVDYCNEHALNDKVKFIGYIPNNELVKYYSAADIFVHASEREAQALCEIEAYASGLKIILNQKIASTVATDFTDSTVYYVLDFNNEIKQDICLWSEQHVSRHSRTNVDWASIVKRYYRYYNAVLCFSLK